MSRDELEPCPFCGAEPRPCDFVGDEDCGYWAIECLRSGVDHFAGVHGDTEEGTIREWNQRATLTSPRGEMVERVAMAIWGKIDGRGIPEDDRELMWKRERERDKAIYRSAAAEALATRTSPRPSGESVDPDVKRRLLSVCDTLESARAQAFPIDFNGLAADIRAALSTGSPSLGEIRAQAFEEAAKVAEPVEDDPDSVWESALFSAGKDIAERIRALSGQSGEALGQHD